METVRRKVSVILVLSLAALAAFSPMAMAAGSLEPSAPPGPVMKSLDEVEPRIPIKASDFPLTITQRGSYYLTQDVNFTDTAHHAITVACDNVTIDLKGYTITGPNSTSYSGIVMMIGRANVEISNGTVRDFYNGIFDGSSSGRWHKVINIRAVSNLNNGIFFNSSGNLVKDCTAVENGNFGISVWNDSTVTGNMANYNGGTGVVANSGCTVTGNTATHNGGSGISASYLCTVTGNTASNNNQDGILTYGSSTVTSNTCIFNGYNGDGAGIHATSAFNRIEGNHVLSNDRGIDVDYGSNLIVKNSAGSNTTGYDIVANNKVGTISTDPTTAGPWDNFNL